MWRPFTRHWATWLRSRLSSACALCLAACSCRPCKCLLALIPRRGRSKKLKQARLLNVLSVGVAAAMNLLALYCATQARAHTAHPGAAPTAYNSSASAVLAIWLIFQTYLVNALRSALPQFQFPVIIYSIFTCVSSTYGGQHHARLEILHLHQTNPMPTRCAIPDNDLCHQLHGKTPRIFPHRFRYRYRG